MKLEAGGKPWRRKPSAAPAVIAASTAAPVRSSESAITARVAAEMTHTPAARPSTPSMRLMTFIIATSPTSVTICPRCTLPRRGALSTSTVCRLTPPTNGTVNSPTVTPLNTGIIRRRSARRASIRPAARGRRRRRRARQSPARRRGLPECSDPGEKEHAGHQRAREHREPAEPRRRNEVQAALAWHVDRADPAGEAPVSGAPGARRAHPRRRTRGARRSREACRQRT